MYRRTIRPFYSSFFRKITLVNRSTPCLYLQANRYCHNIPLPTPQWKPTTDSEAEEKLCFSSLDPDEFGTLSKEPKSINEVLDEMPEEPGDVEEFVVRNKEGKKQRRPLKFYHYLIKDLLSQKKIVDAIDVLEVRMKQDRIRPDYYCYNLLINGCAKVGYCRKAFKLYTQMKKNKVKRTPATYTGLFNACATSPEPEDSLIRLNNLRKNLRDSRFPLTIINYNALIKAYARLKDIQSTFQVVDEILSNEFTLKADTFCFLLQGCVSDKENGMRHALLTWHKMRQKKVKPTLYAYNLFIRCIRDCDFGDEDDVREAIKSIVGASSNSTILLSSGTSSENDQKLLGEPIDGVNSIHSDNSHSPESEKPEFTFEEIEMVENRPNLLAKNPYLGSIISIRNVKTPTDRLLLLGGYKNLLNEMEKDGVKPDIKTFTQLLSVMPSTENAEKYLMKELEKYNVLMDIDFCNMLIKQRALRFDYPGAKQVLSIIQSNYLQPDIITFGVLAMSCQNGDEVRELLQNMRDFSMRLNMEILGTMVQGACVRFNFNLVLYLMKMTRKFGISPNEMYMNHLEALNKRSIEMRRALRKKIPVPSYIERDKYFRENSLVFTDYFAQWKKEVDIFKPPHPYKQFRKSKEDVEEVTEKSKKLSRREDDEKFSEETHDDYHSTSEVREERHFRRRDSRRPAHRKTVKWTEKEMSHENTAEMFTKEDETHDGYHSTSELKDERNFRRSDSPRPAHQKTIKWTKNKIKHKNTAEMFPEEDETQNFRKIKWIKKKMNPENTAETFTDEENELSKRH